MKIPKTLSGIIAALSLVSTTTYIAYKFYIWSRFQYLLRKSGIPMVPYRDSNILLRPLGNFLYTLKHFNRAYELRFENFIALKALTIGIPSPIWSAEPIIQSADPVVIRHILKDKFDIYIKPSTTIGFFREILGNGIFGINHGPHADDGGASWNLQRKTASKVFTNNNFKTLMYEVFSEHAEKTIKVVKNKLENNPDGVVEMQTLMYRYTLDSIGQIGFGVELGSLSQEDVPFATSFDKVQLFCSTRFMSPFWDVPILGRLLYKNERELPKHLEVLDAFAYNIINKRRDEIARGVGTTSDILTLFLQERLGLSDVELRDVVMSFVIAGRDTTASTLSSALVLLAENPEWQEKLRQEVKDKLGDRPQGKRALNSQDISQMKLLQNVIMETLRLYPPVPIDIKWAAEDDILPGGFPIPKGSRVAFEPYVMGRLEQFWGADVLVFNPDRWLKLSTLPSPYEFPQFQAGPRICLGESLAKFEASLLLAMIVDNFQFSKPSPDTVYSLGVGVTLNFKTGVPLRIKPI